MNDNNQVTPQLTLEEELDVLEAVYRIGKEKGLELLRPDQVKKLRDGGRMSKRPGANLAVTGEKSKLAPILLLSIRKAVVNFMINVKHYCSWQEWENKSEEVKNALTNTFVYLVLGVSSKNVFDLINRLFNEDRNAT